MNFPIRNSFSGDINLPHVHPSSIIILHHPAAAEQALRLYGLVEVVQHPLLGRGAEGRPGGVARGLRAGLALVVVRRGHPRR